RVLEQPIDARERAHLRASLRGLLAFQKGLGSFPKIRNAPNGTPFVTLYAKGRLVGCQGSMEGAPAERLGRAFLRALEDPRYGGIVAEDRATLSASVSYPRNVRQIRLSE